MVRESAKSNLLKEQLMALLNALFKIRIQGRVGSFAPLWTLHVKKPFPYTPYHNVVNHKASTTCSTDMACG